MNKNWKKFTAEQQKKFQKLQFTFSWASIEDVQATGVAFSPQSEHPALQNMKFFNFLAGNFCPAGSVSGFLIRIR
jgi:hypothetical protein